MTIPEVIQLDLSTTPLAASDELFPLPSENELFAIILALLVVEGKSITVLHAGCIELNETNVDLVTQTILQEFPLFFQRATSEQAIRSALGWFVGIRIAGIGQDPLAF